MSERTLQFGTAVIWVAVLLGISVFIEAEQGRNLDWELMWVIVGGFLAQSGIIHFYIKADRS